MLSTTGEYALRAVIYLAQHANGHPTPANVVAEALSLPQNYLSKTLNRLAREGILESRRGPRGGFRLAKPPMALQVTAIVGHPSNERGPLRCLLADRPCEAGNRCPAHDRWSTWMNAAHSMMEGTTVADLLRSSGSDLSRPDPGSG